ncbi:MAG: M48 family metalloprotease [Desulfobacterales bacterium]|jgi:predicted Zn-dependent protease
MFIQSTALINKAKTDMRRSNFFFCLSCLLLIALTTACSTYSKPDVSLVSDALLTNEDEQMLWQKSEQEQLTFENNGLIYPDQELEDYLNQVAARLKPQSVPEGLEIRVKVIKNSYLNAFAYPNGIIYIHTGLLARMDNEDQLAAVLAHELIHCTQRHALRAFRRYREQPAILTAVQHALLKTRGLQEIARNLGVTGAMAAISGYVREMETEADLLGIELMTAAGYNPEEAFFLFDHMITEIEREGLEEPIFFGSHPKVQQRVDNLQNLSDPVYLNTRPPIKNPEIYYAKLGQLFLDNASLDIRLGRFQTAKRGIEKFLQIKPDDSRAFFLLGEIYRQQGQAIDTHMALKNYNRAIALDPGYAAPHKAIGLIHYKNGHHALAKKFFESCLQLSPNAPDKAYIRGYLRQCTLSEEG